MEQAAKAKQGAEEKRRQETDDWAKVASGYDIAAIGAFLQKWPGGQHAGAAGARKRELEAFSVDTYQRIDTHPEEWFSILLALVATIGAAIFIGYYPHYTPAGVGGGVNWALPVWIGFIYFIIQMTFLAFSASQDRILGVLDSALAIAPVISGLVILQQSIMNDTFELYSYQMNSLAVLIVTGTSEFLLTIWIRYLLNENQFLNETRFKSWQSKQFSHPFSRWG